MRGRKSGSNPEQPPLLYLKEHSRTEPDLDSAGMLLWVCPQHKSERRRVFPVPHVSGEEHATEEIPAGVLLVCPGPDLAV